MRPDLCHIHHCIINILCNNWNPTSSKKCLYLCFLGYSTLGLKLQIASGRVIIHLWTLGLKKPVCSHLVPSGRLNFSQPCSIPALASFSSVSRMPCSCAHSRSNDSLLCKICITQLLPPLGNCMNYFQQFFLGPCSSSQGDNEDMCQS